ncbi:MAG: ABC transporter ATP-binding protein [Nitrososphaeria archaeon]
MSKGEALLRLVKVSKSYGGVPVLRDVSLDVGEGELVALIGPNGAGKTTLYNVICGVVRPDSGRIYFMGRDITGLPPERICRMGIARTHQVPRPFGNMSVLENVMVAASHAGGLDMGRAAEAAMEILRTVGLAGKAHARADSLTIYELKVLELARALAARPRLLLLDEPFASLSPWRAEEALALIRRLRDEERITIIWVEHVMGLLRKAADRVVVLSQGEKIADGPFRSVVHSAEVMAAYLGEKIVDDVG